MSRLHLFEAYGVEIETMIVDRSSLDLRPLSDQLLAAANGGTLEAEIELGELAWSNELVMHVIEFKTNGPARALEPLPELFLRDMRRADALLASLGARLLPGGMHPWMDPFTETRLWPHDSNTIYERFHAIFDCRGHGWSNLQSTHLNLPFANDAEFDLLHGAVRLLLPLLPALSAASPVADGHLSGFLDTRLEVYRKNCARIPSVSGRVVPEPVSTRADYEDRLLAGIHADLAPHDPDGVLRHEWVNARGAIARFDRFAVEIRTLDAQECPLADLALCALIVAVLRRLIDGRWAPLPEQVAWDTERLATHFLAAVRDGERAMITDSEYLALFGLRGTQVTLQDVWRQLLAEVCASDADFARHWSAPLTHIVGRGPLARRLMAALGADPDRNRLHAVSLELADCLRAGRLFG
ncbi:MAG: glutamate--cysteine ligase [Planctomycetota bacterium]|nr:MAG: glutamate--cysteine ligase [Planctomycetota bacterium]